MLDVVELLVAGIEGTSHPATDVPTTLLGRRGGTSRTAIGRAISSCAAAGED
jgi:hypothetical protein